MTQSKLESLIEAFVNILIGYSVAIAAQLVIYPIYGGTFTLAQNLEIGVWFTLVSLLRSYVIRRYFNQRLHRSVHRLTEHRPRGATRNTVEVQQ